MLAEDFGLLSALVKLDVLDNFGIVQAAQKAPSISVADYLAGESQGEIRHEYIGGLVYAMAGASSEHNIICLNLAFALRSHLRGTPCQVFMVDLKARLSIAGEDVFYYPDLMAACDPRDTDHYFRKFPKVLIEVSSPETERIHRREKFSGYTRLETLEEYILVSQERMEVTVFRKANNWLPEIANRRDDRLRVPSLEFSLSLPAIYENAPPPPK